MLRYLFSGGARAAAVDETGKRFEFAVEYLPEPAARIFHLVARFPWATPPRNG
jgi:hypothetical protein